MNTPTTPSAQRIGNALMHDERDHRNALAINRKKNSSLLYSSIYASKMKEASAEQRMAAANILNAHLLMVEIMMANIMQKYVYDVYSDIESRGMMRHSIKKNVKQMRTVAFDLQSRCNSHDMEQVRTFCRNIYPSLLQDYIDSGGTLTTKMQLLFQQNFSSQLNQIYFATKNAIDRAKIPCSDLCAKIQMVAMLAHTGIEFYEVMCGKVDRLLDGFGRVTRLKSNHNEKLLCAAKELMRTIGNGNQQLPEKESADARTFAAHFQKELVSEGLLGMVESGILSLMTDYIEYVIATLRIKLSRKEMTITDIRTLLARVGSIKNVRRLLDEIDFIPFTDDGEMDAMDLSPLLPDSKAGSALATFRRLCLDDHVLMPEKEDERKVRQREVRQEARGNAGLLPVGTLKALYAEMGTKKAVSMFLKEAGSELDKSVNELNKLKIKDLKDEERG